MAGNIGGVRGDLDGCREEWIERLLPLAGSLARQYRVTWRTDARSAYEDARSQALLFLVEILTEHANLARHPGEITRYVQLRLEGAMQRWHARERASGITGIGRQRSREDAPPRFVTDGQPRDPRPALDRQIALGQALTRLDPVDADLVRHRLEGGTLAGWAAAHQRSVSWASKHYTAALAHLKTLLHSDDAPDR